ncbi:MAG: 6-phosphofructokinase [Xanthomonadales bacterium]|nr:6-phosphofructokinase [Xanthomonadales bacterium]
MAGNLLYAQSGGVTAVINATAAAVIGAAREAGDSVGTVFGARNGILGVLRDELYKTDHWTEEDLRRLDQTPGGVFGSCRYKLKPMDEDDREHRRIIEVLKAHDVRYFLYNGGNDSADTAFKISRIGERMGYPVTCIGVPKTVDNDLPVTDASPGFASAAKYLAVSAAEVDKDIYSMHETSTKVFIMEVMGRHAGWLAAATGLASRDGTGGPHIILFPEVTFDEARFLERVQGCVDEVGYCMVVASEGVRGEDGNFLADQGKTDAFGHRQLGGVASVLADLVDSRLGLKNHHALVDYLQRSARHLASAVDLEHARAVGRAAVEYAVAGHNSVMPVIERLSDDPYRWQIRRAELSEIANVEHMVPKSFITEDGFGITDACRRYLRPLIEGEAYPTYADGLPVYGNLPMELAESRLPAWQG